MRRGDRPEEFPIFTDWWLGKPQPDDNDLTLYAILDSVSCTGAYEFVIQPGETHGGGRRGGAVFPRTERDPRRGPERASRIKTIGLAPLTSMFWFGKNSERKFDDYRPEVHDSDGLLVHMGNGEMLWRPLDNPPVMRHQVFHAPNIRGFGLLQRERDFAAYQDMFNLYQQVPSVWVEPRGDWGDGDLHLVELSTQLRGPGQHRRVLGSEEQTRAAAAVTISATRFTGRRRGGPETFREPRRLHAHRPRLAFRERAAVRH